MGQNLIRTNIEEMESLNPKEKELFKELNYKVSSELFEKNKSIDEGEIFIDRKNGLHMILKSRKTKKNKPSSVESAVNALNLSEKVTKHLSDKVKNGQVFKYNIGDINKAQKNLSILPDELQLKAVDKIIQNRKEAHLRNLETTATLALQAGITDDTLIDYWYKGLLDCINELIGKFNVGHEFYQNLYLEQKEHLAVKLQELKTRLKR